MNRDAVPEELWLRFEQADPAAVEELLEAGTVTLEEALWSAAYRGRPNLVRSLVARGADPNRPHPYNCPILIAAANMGRTGAVRALLACGADPNVRDCEADGGLPALAHAVAPDIIYHRGHAGAVRALLKAGADPNARDSYGATPLMFVRDADWPVMDALVRAGADVNARDSHGGTPLMWAAWRGRHNNVRRLLEVGADPSARDNCGASAFVYAVTSGFWATERSFCLLYRAGGRATEADRQRISAEVEERRICLAAILEGDYPVTF